MADRRVSKTPRPKARLPKGMTASRGLQSVDPTVRANAAAEPLSEPDMMPVRQVVDVEHDPLITGVREDPMLRSRHPAPVPDGSSRLTAHAATYAGSSMDGGARVTPDGTRVEQILVMLKRHFDDAVTGDAPNVDEGLIDDDFRNLDQWEPEARRVREDRGEIVLTVDQLSTPILHVVNAHRNSLPAIKVSARGGRATKRTAEVAQNLIRRIEYDSFAPSVYGNAVDSAATNGRGHWEITVEYASDKTMDKELRVTGIRNRYSVYRDPTSVAPDRSDARYWIKTEDYSVDDFRAIWGERALASAVQFSSAGDPEWAEWVTEETIRVVTYYFKVHIRRRLFQLGDERDGRWVQMDMPDPEDYLEGSGTEYEGLDDSALAQTGDHYTERVNGTEALVPITDHRDIDCEQWYVCTANAVEILEGEKDPRTGRYVDAAIWPFPYAPIIEVAGEEFMVRGRLVQRGLIRRGRDAQRLFNANITDLFYAQVKTPKHQWSGFAGQFGSGPDDPVWKQYMAAATGAVPFVQAAIVLNPVTKEVLPAPVLNTYEPPIQNLVLGINMAMQFIKDTTGFHSPAVGDLSPQERSGKAIENLQRATDQGTSHIAANFEVALAHSGRVMASMLDAVYNNRPGRLVHLQTLDGDEEAILMRQAFRPTPDGPQALPDGVSPIVGQDQYIDLRDCEHQIAVRPGRQSLTADDEARRAYEAIVTAVPGLAQIIAPSWIRSIDAPHMEALADLIEQTLPPQFRMKKDGPPPIPPEVQQAMQQMQQIIQVLTQELQAAQMEQEADAVKAASQERIAAMNNQVKLLTAILSQAAGAATAGRQDGLAMMQSYWEQLKLAGSQAHERVMGDIEIAKSTLAAKSAPAAATPGAHPPA